MAQATLQTQLNNSSLPVSNVQSPLIKTNRKEKIPHKQIIRDLGLKVTEQRVLILDIIRNGSNHFTAQEVFERVNARNPDVGFATATFAI